ncbi:uncharacterized protein LOC132724238 [Ruditapes philippinarum]|uniref:uncharacterized protein LOC132724238 n=1 Tax=Ruditapes philippinarum TaxID=129788 RepID=UPI00295B7682|nr:uncharacterized protein LOC132724238 [Ruditapes philippinarum]
MEGVYITMFLTSVLIKVINAEIIQLPPFSQMKKYYPGFYNFGGSCRNHEIIALLGIEDRESMLLHDTTALRLSYTLNKIGNQHSLGNDVIRLSKNGTDSVSGKDGLQYIFHPLAFGPYLADKYGYPTVTKMHLFDSVKTKASFSNKQGIMRIITYTQHDNKPKGHLVLWDCNGVYQSRDFFYGHTLLSVEFWESPDTNCSDRQHVETNDNDKDEVDSYILSVLKESRHESRRRRHCLQHG